MTNDDVLRRGAASARLLADETAMGALVELETEFTAAWVTSKPTDSAGREDTYRMTRCVQMIRDKLRAWRDAGMHEQSKINEADKLARSPQTGVA